MFSDDNIVNFYRTNFELKTEWQYSQTEIDNMLPYERDIVIDLIKHKIEEQKKSQNG